jgi:hypothetical protein
MIPLSRDQKSSTPLIEIYCGTSLSIFVTSSKSPVSAADRDGYVRDFLPEPAIRVNLPKQTGGLTEDPCEVTIPYINSQHIGLLTLGDMLKMPRAVPPVEIRISTIIQSAAGEAIRVFLYEGVLDKDIRNPRKAQGIIEMHFLPEYLLGLEDATIGRRADAVCDAVFGKTMCWVDTTQFFSAASGQRDLVRKAHVICTLSGPASDRLALLDLDPLQHPGYPTSVLTDHSEGWWVKGFLEKDGLRILIADWRWNPTTSTGTDQFILSRIPPVSWDGASMILHPGCQRTPGACLKRQGNYEFFAGLGYGIPAYNPTLEYGDS